MRVRARGPTLNGLQLELTHWPVYLRGPGGPEFAVSSPVNATGLLLKFLIRSPFRVSTEVPCLIYLSAQLLITGDRLLTHLLLRPHLHQQNI